MEVECEQEPEEEDDAVVIIEDDVEESVSSAPVKIKNVKSLQLSRPDVAKLHVSNGANVSDRANTFLPNAPSLPESCLPTMPRLVDNYYHS